MEAKKYYYLYQITNKTTHEIYVGVHETYNLDDGYLGSGTRLALAKKKYGIESFEKVILKFFDTQEEMYQEEGVIVDLDFIMREDVYNLIPGGRGGGLLIEENRRKGIEASRSPESKAKRDATMRRLGKGPKYDPTFTIKGQEASKRWENLIKRVQTRRVTGSYETENAGRYGTAWITNGREEAVIQKGDSIPDGWDYGRSEESSEECMKWYLSLTQDVRREMTKHARQIQQKKYNEDPEYLAAVVAKREITRKANQEKNGYKQKDSLTKEERSAIAKKNRAIQQAKLDSDPEYKARIAAKRAATYKITRERKSKTQGANHG